MRSIRHSDFSTCLKNIVESHPGQITIALRAGGALGDSNIVIRFGQVHLEWRVGIQGGRIRSDSWNVANQIGDVVSGSNFPAHIQAVYEQALNGTRDGWVVLTVENGRAMRAELRNRI